MNNNELNILKHTLYFLIFVIVTLMLFFMLIIPSYRELKLSNIELAKENIYADSVLQSQKMYSDDFKKLNDEKKFKSISFYSHFNIEKFKEFTAQNIKDLEIKKLKNENYLDNFIKTSYQIKGMIQSPESFYQMLLQLKKYENVIEVKYPIEFEMMNGNLWVSIVISVCNDVSIKES